MSAQASASRPWATWYARPSPPATRPGVAPHTRTSYGMLARVVKTCAGMPTSSGFAPSSTRTATRCGWEAGTGRGYVECDFEGPMPGAHRLAFAPQPALAATRPADIARPLRDVPPPRASAPPRCSRRAYRPQAPRRPQAPHRLCHFGRHMAYHRTESSEFRDLATAVRGTVFRTLRAYPDAQPGAAPGPPAALEEAIPVVRSALAPEAELWLTGKGAEGK